MAGICKRILPRLGTHPALLAFFESRADGFLQRAPVAPQRSMPKTPAYLGPYYGYAPNRTLKAVAAGGVVLLTGTDDVIGDVFSEACERGCEEISLASGLARRFRPWKFYSAPKAGPWIAAIGPPAES